MATKKPKKKDDGPAYLSDEEMSLLSLGSQKALNRQLQIKNADLHISLLDAKQQNASLLLQIARQDGNNLTAKLQLENDAYKVKVEELRKKYKVTKLGYDPISGEIYKG